MNMSYCRFHNTNIDLDQCLNVFEESDDETISVEEKQAAKKMFGRFLEFCLENGIIEDCDYEAVDDLIDGFPKD